MKHEEYRSRAFVTNRLTRTFGNLVKLFGYLFHFFFPRKRFAIPKSAPSWRSVAPFSKGRQHKEARVTKVLWQTNYTRFVSLPVYVNYLFNRLMSFDYSYRFFDDDDILDYIQGTGDKQMIDAYERLNVGAAKADFWRYVVLLKEGGVYVDVDGCLVCPLGRAINREMENLYCETKADFTNYFMASEPGHPILEETVKRVVKSVNEGDTSGHVYHLTGPKVLNDALEGRDFHYRAYRVLCVQGLFSSEYFQYLGSTQSKWTKVKEDQIFK